MVGGNNSWSIKKKRKEKGEREKKRTGASSYGKNYDKVRAGKHPNSQQISTSNISQLQLHTNKNMSALGPMYLFTVY